MWDQQLPTVYQNWSFATFPSAKAGESTRSAVLQAQEAARIGQGVWAFAGGSGAGKTGLVVAVIRALPGQSLLCTDGFTLMVRLTEMVAGKRPRTLLNELQEPDVLFIDDLGYAISSETSSRRAATQALQDILLTRAGRLTLITLSGRSSDQSTYLQLCAWLRRVGHVVDLGPDDLRQQLFAHWEPLTKISGPEATHRLRPAEKMTWTAVNNETSVITPEQSGATALPPVENKVILPSYTICFICKGKQVLLLNRKNHPFMGLWNGVGGKLEIGEHPRMGVLREVREETGIELADVQQAGVVSWHGDITPNRMYVFIGYVPDNFAYETPRYTDEGILAWCDLSWVYDPSNEGVVSNIRRFLPAMLAGQFDLEYRLMYRNGTLVGYETLPLSTH